MALQSLPSDRVMQDIPIIAPVNVAQFPFSYMYLYAASDQLPVKIFTSWVFFSKFLHQFLIENEDMFSFFLSSFKPLNDL